MRIVVTGGDGFIGRNLRLHLREQGHDDVVNLERDTPAADFASALASAEFVYHLAGVNRPVDVAEFDTGNRGLTALVCDALRATGRAVPLVYTSSTQATLDNSYGVSKRASEAEAARYAADSGAPVRLFRLPNVFGKWCRPNYNSVVATFCHNIARGEPITINDPSAPLRLVYVDDVVEAMAALLGDPAPGGEPLPAEVEPVYTTTVGEVAAMLREFAASRQTRMLPPAGTGFTRALYATYLSYLPPDAFAYRLVPHTDSRGVFAEMLRTPDCGQISFFTAHPGVTRGGHYHHTKNEKFLVVTGRARFGFRHVVTGEEHELVVSGGEARVVETVPGWAHDVTNVGEGEMVVLLWANEIFDPAKPDTIAAPVTA
jgi:UDP-2-acetamido-2,6-beta-L-arabino-hexul-4-ose reductase